MMSRFLNVVVALWACSLLTICLIVAPSLFVVLTDRHMAGDAAGHFFRVESWLGLAFGGVALVLLSRAAQSLRGRINLSLLVVSAATPLINEVVLRPFMEDARAAGDMQKFGTLHAVGALLFAIACVASLALLWRVSRRAE
ncbi:MAG TPA: DUF4149 domain-containing protein [Steroidobacteraceae bacterium]|nr:DUF4149 domain-containing protein [Steroidobacteraceae bacterium]